MPKPYDLFCRRYRSQRIGYLRKRYQFCLWSQQLKIFFHDNLSVVIYRDYLNLKIFLIRHLLPGNYIGMMLQVAQDDFVAGLYILFAPAFSNQVYGFCGSPDKNNLVNRRGI